MTNKKWKKIVNEESKIALKIATREHKRGNRLSEEFFLGYFAGINYAIRVMNGENGIPEFDYENMTWL